MTDNVKS